LQHHRNHRDLHSFPTRRSSDLFSSRRMGGAHGSCKLSGDSFESSSRLSSTASSKATSRKRTRSPVGRSWPIFQRPARTTEDRPRSEEHTSELQSRGHLVCRLLL